VCLSCVRTFETWGRDVASNVSTLVKLSSLPVWLLVRVERLLSDRFGFLLSGSKHAFLVASDALVRVQAFQDELCAGYLLLSTFLLGNSERAQLVDQALNSSQ